MDTKGSGSKGTEKAKILVFAGTSEGRRLAELAKEKGFLGSLMFSVATDYGKELLQETEGTRIREGRIDAGGMEDLMEILEPLMVVDATHPFAVEASRQIREAAAEAGVRYVRMVREGDDIDGSCPDGLEEGVVIVKDADQAAAVLSESSEAFLLTTGSKDLGIYRKVPGFSERAAVRVLPSAESLRKCEEAGVQPARVIAMQGPFTKEMNAATMEQYGAETIVTKETGKAGGFEGKIALARRGYRVIVIGRPKEDEGVGFEEAARLIEDTLLKG